MCHLAAQILPKIRRVNRVSRGDNGAPMERFLLGLLLGLVSVGSGTPTWSPAPTGAETRQPRPPLEAGELHQVATAAAHRVFAFGCGTASNTGTAVALDDGRLLTNRHVVEGSLLINVASDAGPTVVAQATVHPTADLALLQSPPTGGRPVRLAPVDPAPGAELLIAGFVEGELGLRLERVSLVDYAPGGPRGHDGQLMRLDHRAGKGMSGAPVIDEWGQLAGLVFAVENPPGVTLSIPASELADALIHPDATFLPNTRCG